MTTCRKTLYGASGLIGLGSLVLGAVSGHPGWFAPALVSASSLGALWIGRRKRWRQEAASLQEQVEQAVTSPPAAGSPIDTEALVDEMLTQGRYALLLRPQIAPNLTLDQLQRALAALAEQTAYLPPGQLCIGLAGKESEPVENQDFDLQNPGEVVEVDDYRLDKYCVTNRQFQYFVAAGGYTQAALWDPQVWPAVVEFVDRTGTPGPRFWHHGKYTAGEAEHPVVGLSWYEAAAYARWLGKRLPTDPEWEKAGCWPVQLDDVLLLQRRHPWGDVMERERANLWGTGPGKTVPVDRHAEGDSPGGVRQLIGNTWEWTHDDFAAGPYQRRGLTLSGPMKSIRGAAFDTYFDHQATCQFQSGENPLNRKHNISFRCAISACDLALAARRLQPADDDRSQETPAPAAVEEVCV
jgi:iron(II)-dependent oxidoreductase